MTLTVLSELIVVIFFGVMLFGSIGLAIYSTLKKEPVLPEEKTNEKLDEIIDILHCIASDKLDAEAMKDLQNNTDNDNDSE